MNVPCPSWPQGPWSPLGYQVVEVAEENVPAPHARPQSGRHEPEEELNWPQERQEAAPVCRLIELALEEIGQKTASEQAPQGSGVAGAANRPSAWKLRPLARWGAIAGGCTVLLMAALTLAARRLPARGHAMPATAPSAPEHVLPGTPRCCAKDSRAITRETFGTSVGFVGSPAEAAQVAAREQKLTCLLHVSGSFEEARFT